MAVASSPELRSPEKEGGKEKSKSEYERKIHIPMYI